MGLQVYLPAANNHMNIDMPEAYIRIEELNLREEQRGMVISFTAKVYSNEEGCRLSESETDIQLIDKEGGHFQPNRMWFDCLVGQIYLEDNAAARFPNGIPSDRDTLVTACYAWLQEYLESIGVDAWNVL